MGFVKDKIEYIVYKEVHPKDFNPNRIGIVLLRDFKSINKSIKSMYNKLHGIYIPQIRKSPYINKKQYEQLEAIASLNNVLAIKTELFILYPKLIINQIKKFLDLKNPFPDKKDIIAQGCNCGEKFTTKVTDILPSEKKKLIDKQEFYFCKKHNSILVGGGGYNPKNDFDISKSGKLSIDDLKIFNQKYNNLYF